MSFQSTKNDFVHYLVHNCILTCSTSNSKHETLEFCWCSGYHICLTRRRSQVRHLHRTFQFFFPFCLCSVRLWLPSIVDRTLVYFYSASGFNYPFWNKSCISWFISSFEYILNYCHLNLNIGNHNILPC